MTGVDGGWDWPDDPFDPLGFPPVEEPFDPAGSLPGPDDDDLGPDWFADGDQPWPGTGSGSPGGAEPDGPHLDDPDGRHFDDPDGPHAGAAGAAPAPVFGAAEVTEHAGWADPQFPPPLDLAGLPEPVDGPPWTDPALLGDDPVPPLVQAGGVDPADLLEYAALDDPGGDAWPVLRAADDPATAALARWWER